MMTCCISFTQEGDERLQDMESGGYVPQRGMPPKLREQAP